PPRKPSVPELQVKPVAAARERRPLYIGQRGQEFVTRTPAYVMKRHAKRLRRLIRCHAERQGDVGRRQLRRSRRAAGEVDDRNEGSDEIQLSIAAHARHSTATSVPPGVQPPPSAWNRLVAASSLLSRTWTSVFSAVNSVC